MEVSAGFCANDEQGEARDSGERDVAVHIHVVLNALVHYIGGDFLVAGEGGPQAQLVVDTLHVLGGARHAQQQSAVRLLAELALGQFALKED